MPRSDRSEIPTAASLRRSTNVKLPASLLQEARALGIVSQACERGLVVAVAERRRHRWLEDNKEAIEAWNDHVDKNGLPLGEFRQS